MKINLSVIGYFLGFVFTISCNQKKPKTKIAFRIHHAKGFKIFLQPLTFAGETKQILDSETVKSGNELIIFNVPASEQRPYNLKVWNSRLDIFFINDAPEITIEANILKPKEFSVQHSPATMSVKEFLDRQKKLAEQIQKKFEMSDSSKAKVISVQMSDSMFQEKNRTLSDFFQQYINYADTVSNPGAFLYIYNNIDFGKNYAGLKKFILKAAARFPSNKPIQHLKDETLDYLKTFEIEYTVGDYLPELHLPDQRGQEYYTSFLKSKYVFMDFWSTWCEACLKYDVPKSAAKKKFPADKFEIVSIALDAEKDAWKHYIEAKNYNWIQLIDEKMWQGPTLKTYRIDSIPFNFLLNPEGKIIYKAIKPDSLVPILSKLIK
jgi:thiol-disulfide isomerase/thioredoxin